MAPEQLAGENVDARADIFAFGAVLYEMVTGRKAFDVNWNEGAIDAVRVPSEPLEASTPPALARIIRTCLEPDRDNRWASIRDVGLQLRWMAHQAEAPEGERDGKDAHGTRTNRRRGVVATIAALVAAVCLLILWRWPVWARTPAVATQRFSVELGVDGALAATDVPFALSPDGTLLAFVARAGQKSAQLYVRHLDQLASIPLSGTERASMPCFSPDAQWLAFFSDAKLKKIPVNGGTAVALADAPSPRGAWWAEDGTIVLAPDKRTGLMRVSSAGGQPQPLTKLADGEISHRFPQVLPGGTAVLYTASTEVSIGTDSKLVIQPLPTGDRVVVERGGYFGRYLSSGHIIYVQDEDLFVMPFDGNRLKAGGRAGRIGESVRSDLTRGSAPLAVSEAGTIAYVAGGNTFAPRGMAWMDRAGGLTTLRVDPADWYNPEFSPDGERLAMEVRAAGSSDIRVYEWARDAVTRVTSEPGDAEFPVWTADGKRITYRSSRAPSDPGGYRTSWTRADGTGDAQVLVRDTAPVTPASWHPSSKFLAYVTKTKTSGDDIMILPMQGNDATGWTPGRPTAFVNSPARERAPAFSPDGRWLSYTSDESGVDQVYVMPFPGPGARVMVSSAGGRTSSWSHSRPEMVFIAPAVDYMFLPMVASYRVQDGTFLVSKPRLWAEGAPLLRELLGSRMYALHPDGLRLAVAPPPDVATGPPSHLTFVLNLADELRRMAPASP